MVYLARNLVGSGLCKVFYLFCILLFWRHELEILVLSAEVQKLNQAEK